MRYEEPVMEVIVLNTADIQTLESVNMLNELNIPGMDMSDY